MRKNYILFLLAGLLYTGMSQAQVVQTFTFTGSAQTFTIPSCVTEVTIEARGASGSNGNASTSPAGIGGNGAIVTGTYAVSGGDVLNIFVGGAGTLTTGGFNGGGISVSNSSAGGGGATDIRFNGSALVDRILVAGGGGAGGNGGCFGANVPGGNGGGGGANGTAGTNSTAGGGGFPGVGTTGGTFGVGCGPFSGQAGVNGANGVGGAGGLGTDLCSTFPTSGGSGGGGFTGGGGGGAGAAGTVGCQFNDTGAGGGGAGGDCYLDPSMTNTSINAGAANPGNGLVVITYVVNTASIVLFASDARCGPGVVNLLATPWAGIVDWYDAPTGGTFLASGGTYSPSISTTTSFYAEANDGGCISSSRTEVIGIVYNVDLGITQTSFNELTADQSGAVYQWFDCTTNQPIAGETSQTFTATVDGSYGVMVSLGVCNEMTPCIDLIFAGLEEYASNFISVYPNPTTGSVTLDLSNVEATHITVFDVQGSIVLQENGANESMVLDMSNHASGIYLLQVETTKGTVHQRIVKK